jgi:DNA adenine methylase
VLAGCLTELIEKIPHQAYVEPFVGMGGVFFRRRRRPKLEVVNDLAGDVTTLFRVLQRHYVAFVEMLRHQITSRAEFERLVKTDPNTLTDLERAARFFYLQRAGHGGKTGGRGVTRSFGVSPSEHASFDVTRIVPSLADYHERLAGVVIGRLPFEVCIAKYDRPGTLFFLDPPYMGTEHYYGDGLFAGADFAHLADQLAGIHGRFILTINDCPQARKVFGRFKVGAKGLHYHVGGGARTKVVRELIVQGGGRRRGSAR